MTAVLSWLVQNFSMINSLSYQLTLDYIMIKIWLWSCNYCNESVSGDCFLAVAAETCWDSEGICGSLRDSSIVMETSSEHGHRVFLWYQRDSPRSEGTKLKGESLRRKNNYGSGNNWGICSLEVDTFKWNFNGWNKWAECVMLVQIGLWSRWEGMEVFMVHWINHWHKKCFDFFGYWYYILKISTCINIFWSKL